MISCEKCREKGCTFRDKFDDSLVLAQSELKELHDKQSLLTPVEFWNAMDNFYVKYPLCVMIALDESLMAAYLVVKREQHQKTHSDIF